MGGPDGDEVFACARMALTNHMPILCYQLKVWQTFSIKWSFSIFGIFFMFIDILSN